MSEASKISININNSQENATKVRRVVTLERVIEWIKSHEFDEFTTNELIKLASGYPNTALLSFKKNFNVMLQRVRSKRNKESNLNDSIE